MKKKAKSKKHKPDYFYPVAIFLAMLVISLFSSGKSVITGPGIKAPVAPLQSTPFGNENIPHDTYHIKPLAEFECTAKVISKRKYKDTWSDICPIDYTLGWQHLSDENVIPYISFSQRKRRTYFEYKSLPEGLDYNTIKTQWANTHMCPANSKVRKQLLDFPVGSIIHIKGKLIALSHKESDWVARSSTTRNDTGDGACEIIWVEQIENKT